MERFTRTWGVRNLKKLGWWNDFLSSAMGFRLLAAWLVTDGIAIYATKQVAHRYYDLSQNLNQLGAVSVQDPRAITLENNLIHKLHQFYFFLFEYGLVILMDGLITLFLLREILRASLTRGDYTKSH